MNEFKLSNGIKVLHKKISQNPLVTIQLFFHGGSINEKKHQAGLSNFMQLLLLKGTKKRTSEQLAQEIENIGASIFTDTENDYCSIGISIMDKYVEKAVEILSDVAFNPTFPEKELEKERVNVMAGIKSRKDHIFDVALDTLNSEFYGDHPYSWPDIGKAETVSKFTRDDIINWHKENFIVNDMLMVVVGNTDLQKVKDLTNIYFSSAPSGKMIDASPKADIPKTKKISKNSKKFKQAYIMIAYPSPQLGHPDYPALKVINAMLGGRMSGRLFTELREKLSLAYEVSSFYPSRKELSRFIVYMGLEKNNLDTAKNGINKILEDLKNNPVKEKELQETKNYIKGVYLLDHQTIGRQAWYLGWWEILNVGYEYDKKYLRSLMRVTSKDIQRVANKYFKEPYIQVELIPEK